MKTDLALKYDRRVPRYTSYPTVPHFSAAVDAAAYGRWLEDLAPGSEVSLYAHVPFCAELCWFCGCHTKIVRRYSPVRDYLAVLGKEIDLVADRLPGRLRARRVHVGGGSPSTVKPDDWRRLIDRLRAAFDVTPDAEVAVELDPRTTSADFVKALAESGVNRASLGVQDCHPTVQEAVNRIQPSPLTARLVGWLRGRGIEGINLDLMYGLPHQTVDHVDETVEFALSLRPDRVAVFGYAHVPWMKRHQRLIDESRLPTAEERLRQFERVAARLTGRGYVPIGLDHFALPTDGLARALAAGRLRRNFQGYTDDAATALIGFGASSISALPSGYAQNAAPNRDYTRTVEAGILPVVKGVAVDADDRLRREVIERLMCELTVDVGAICRAHGASEGALQGDLDGLAPLAIDGLVAVEGSRLTVPEDARPLVRVVAAAFDRYLPKAGRPAHSRAV